MSLNTQAPDSLVTCPLDEAHRIRKSRMQFHLVRCMKNHTLEKKIRCPWNPLHIVDRMVYLDHLNSKCEDLCNVMASTIRLEQDVRRDVSSVPVNATNAVLPKDDEDWDAVPCTVGTYDPLKRTENQPILRGSIGLSKAERKRFKLQERRRHQELEKVLPIQIKSKPKKDAENHGVHRMLRAEPKAMSATALTCEDSNSSSIYDDVEKLGKIRRPHGPSEAMSFEAPEEDTSVSRENGDSSIDEYKAYGKVNEPRKSAKKSIQKSAESTSENFAAAGPKKSQKIKKAPNFDARGTIQQEVDASLPETSTSSSADQEIDELSKQLENLETVQKSVEARKAAILQKMSEYKNKSLNDKFDTNPQNTENSSNSNVTTAMGNSSNAPKEEKGFTVVKRKCAANFGKPKNTENVPLMGTGRGIVIDFESFKNRRPIGRRFNQENVKPAA